MVLAGFAIMFGHFLAIYLSQNLLEQKNIYTIFTGKWLMIKKKSISLNTFIKHQ